MTPAPPLETRSAEELHAALVRRLPGYLDGLAPRSGGPGDALLTIFAQYLRALGERIDDAPDKGLLAFLDQLGVGLLAAQEARAPVVFETLPGAGDGRAPAGTRLGATGPDPSRPLGFETERAIALAQARLAEVVTVWPGRDQSADHTAAVLGGRPFTLWAPLAPVPHELYAGHDLHLALSGAASVDLEIDLARGASEQLLVTWSYFDGDAWRSLAVLSDGTAGLTRSGRVRLHSDCAAAKPTTLAGFTHPWLRGALARPLPPGEVAVLPEIDRLRLRTGIDRQVVAGAGGCTGGLIPEQAFGGGAKLDLTKAFFPLGRQAGPDAAFYLACDEAFSRPLAEVTVCVQRTTTAEDTADAELADYELGIEAARQIVEQIRSLAKEVLEKIDALDANELANAFEDLIDDAKLDDVRTHCRDALAALKDAAGPGQLAAGNAGLLAANVNPIAILPPPAVFATVGAAIAIITSAQIVFDLAVGLEELSSGAPQALIDEVEALRTAIDNAQADIDAVGDTTRTVADRIGAAVSVLGAIPGIVFAWGPVAAHLSGWPATTQADAVLPGVVADAEAVYQRLKDRVNAARTKLQNEVRPKLADLIALLDDLSPITLAAAAGVGPPKLADPQLVWEYWDGTRWATLVAPDAAPARNLLASGSFSFAAPENWTPVKANEIDARWLRARLASGAYARIRTVSWEDQKTKEIKFMAVVEPRPPVLDQVRVGYSWSSSPAAPQTCLTANDARWADRTAEAAGRGDVFPPYVPMEDRTPALYLGFDAPLPAGDIGLLADIEEVPGDEAGPRLVWEAWDGATWRGLTVDDETAALALPGILTVTWPGVPEAPGAVVVRGSGTTVELLDARAAARFGAGDEVWLAATGGGALRTVASVAGTTVTLTGALPRAVTQGTLAHAGLARFGTPRTWLRGRLAEDGEPRRARLSVLAHNAVWASQRETLSDELLGSSDGQPRQALFLARTPVLGGQEIEVRELDGPRAAVEHPALVAELAAQGITEDELRLVSDPRTGLVAEVWVPWRERPHLFFSGPDDRHYTLERTRGRVLFGDGVHGAIPPAGADAIRARRYRWGGGPAGNVPAGAVSQVLAGVLVQGVRNPLAANGGALPEEITAVRGRGPLSVRARRQAVTAADFEVLSREASPAVAVARAIPAGTPGRVAVVVVPRSDEPRPVPSFELRRRVRETLRARVPATLRAIPEVAGPDYLPVGVATALVPAPDADAAVLVADATQRLAAFLHPLTGGPDGTGWPFGRGVHASDVAALLGRLSGATAIASLSLLLAGSPQGDHVAGASATGSSVPGRSQSRSRAARPDGDSAPEPRRAPLARPRRRGHRTRATRGARLGRAQRERPRDHAARTARVARGTGPLPRGPHPRAASARIPRAARIPAPATARGARRRGVHARGGRAGDALPSGLGRCRNRVARRRAARVPDARAGPPGRGVRRRRAELRRCGLRGPDRRLARAPPAPRLGRRARRARRGRPCAPARPRRTAACGRARVALGARRRGRRRRGPAGAARGRGSACRRGMPPGAALAGL